MDRQTVGINLKILVWVTLKRPGATQEYIWKKRLKREGSTVGMMGEIDKDEFGMFRCVPCHVIVLPMHNSVRFQERL